MKTNESEVVGSSVHVFERAGLGVAPFKFVGAYESKFQAVPGDPNCPVQPGSSCDYCAQGIMYVCRIRDANGKEFKVGCDCVLRTGDAGLRKVIDRQLADRRRANAQRNADAKIAKASADLESKADALRAQPHPISYQAARGLTRYDWAVWMLDNAGRAGKVKVAKYLATVEGAR